LIGQLIADGRAIRVKVAGREALAAVEDAAVLRDALGVSLPLGLPGAFTGPTELPLERLVARYARTHVPFTVADVAGHLGVAPGRVSETLGALASTGRVVNGEFRPGGFEREWCDAEVLRRIKRRSLAALRAQVEPVDAATYARFLSAWQGADEPAGRADSLHEALGRLQGASLPASILETDVLAARVRAYRQADLDQLCASGELVWIGAGSLGTDDGRLRLVYRDQVPQLANDTEGEPSPTDSPIHSAIRARLAERGASFWPEIVAASGIADERVVLGALWDLVWAGEVTNDTLGPLRAFVKGRAPKTSGRGRPGSLRRTGPPAGAGRWSLVSALQPFAISPTEILHARTMQLLDRYGVLTRETVLAEGVSGGFAAIYPLLKSMEEAGKVRRGYFVAGLGAAQFASPGAVERLRSMRDRDADTQVLAAADPAQPYGATLAWPTSAGRPSRAAGAYLVLDDGEPAAFLERGARSLVTFSQIAGALPHDGPASRWIEALASLVKDGKVRKIELSRIDGEPARDHVLADRLREAGFTDGYRGLLLRS
jgi:ATP-dependent Lhr-like helicase